MERNGITTLLIYIKAAKLKRNKALKKIAASGRKNIICCYQKQQRTSLLKKASCKHAVHH
jgi:hypothetical protein